MIEDQKPRRPLSLGWRTLTIAACAAGIGIAALVALRDPAPASRFTVTASEDDTPAAADPLMAELLRCRLLPAGSDDAACREAWEVNRRRFMGESRSYVPPATAAAMEGR